VAETPVGRKLPVVVVVGDLLYDLISKVQNPLVPGTDNFAEILGRPGGSSANVAAWLAFLGVETHFVGRTGTDPISDVLAEGLKADGVAAHLAQDETRQTGKVVVLVDGAGKRTMITDRGASAHLRPNDLPEDLFRPNAHLHLSGYVFSGNHDRREAALKALRLAREARMTVSVDPASTAVLRDLGPGSFLDRTEGTDLVFPNRDEGALLAGSRDEDRILDALSARYRSVVLKLGAGGARYAGEVGEKEAAAAAEVRAVDTTGAGDALCAAFLASWLSGAPPAAALRRGVELAGVVVGRAGGRPNS
jgi:sugar/nucleoside kinase (ribokinase family)